MVDQVQRNHGCFVSVGHPNTLMNTQEALHSGPCFCTDANMCRKCLHSGASVLRQMFSMLEAAL